MNRIYIRERSLWNLRSDVERRVFAVPDLQREFVWSARKACDLLDSIYRNYPIGAILIWKTDRRNEGQLRKKYHILPQFDPANREIFFLIDGQQRVSVLWHVLRGEGGSVRNAAGDELNFKSFYFNANATEGDRLFLYRERMTPDLTTTMISLIDLLAIGWRRRILGHGSRILKRVEDCRRRILNYKALLVFCETNDRTEVRETFVRINAQGMRISAADAAFARASKLDLRARVREIQMPLQYGFDGIERTSVLQAFAIVLGIKDLGARAIQKFTSRIESDDDEKNRFDRVFNPLRDAFGRAVDYLVHELGVPNLDFLPSEPMVMILALFFFYNRNVRPRPLAKRRLQQWFWYTAIGARYTGRGYRPNLLADIAFVERLAMNPGARVQFTRPIRLSVLKDTDYSRPGPTSNAFLCLLRLHRPRYLEDGSEIPLGEISSRSNRRDKHHIFPRALLDRYQIGPDRFNSIVNICYLVARENQSVGQRSPRNYFQDVPKSARALHFALRSHLIPSKKDRGIWDRSTRRGFKDFVNDRTRVLAKAFERQADMKLFERE